MDDTTKKILEAIAVGAVKKALVAGGSIAAAHGFTTGLPSEAYAGLALALVSALWSFWNDYGRAIVMSQLEVLKAKSLASAAKIKDAGLPPVTSVDIAEQSPTLTPKAVDKIVATMPAVQATVGAMK